MTTRVSVFGSPLFLGFDQMERLVERVAKSAGDGYPPYNIEQIGDSRLRIVLAVAGFRLEDLTISLEENQLVIRGRHSENGDGRVYLHRGIAARQFQRSFVLAEGIEVSSADLADGLLTIDLVRPTAAPAVKHVAIRAAGKSGQAIDNA